MVHITSNTVPTPTTANGALLHRRSLLKLPSAILAASAYSRVHASKRVLVGQSLPLTGPLASYGQAKLLGSQTYFALANSQRSDGMVDIVHLDDKYDPALTVTNTNSLAKEHRVTACLGYFGVPTVNAALPIFGALKIPVVGLTSGSREIRVENRSYVFPVRASYQIEIEKIISHMRTVGIEDVTLVVQNNSFGTEIKDTFLAIANTLGLKNVSSLALANDGSDAVKVVEKINQSTKAIFLASLSKPATAVVQALQDRKIFKQIYGLSALDASYLYQILGAKSVGIIQSQVIPSPFDTTKKICLEYLAALKKFNPQAQPSYFGLEAFIEAKVLYEGIRKSGYSTNPSVVRNSLEQLSFFDLGGLDMSYGPSRHAGLRYVDLTILGTKGNTIR
jgi:branched-chain amino acid transport system substrate-binding protein